MTSTGYVRQSAAQIVTGNTINASDFNNEYNLLQSFADGTVGHDHSGGVGLGPKLSLTTAIAGILPPANGGTGIANNAASTITISGNFATVLTVTAATGVTLPTTGTLATLAGAETLTNKTLTAPIIATISNTGTLTLPTSTDTLVGRATTDTLTNKTLTSATLTTPVISTINNGGTITLPTGPDTLVGRATTDTLTNKTLTSPVIATIVNSGTLTLPTSTDTLVGRATTDTLTNKTLTSATLNSSTLNSSTWNNGTIVTATVNTPTVVGGTIDNSIIGGSIPVAATFTTLVASTFRPTSSTPPALGIYTHAANFVSFYANGGIQLVVGNAGAGATNYAQIIGAGSGFAPQFSVAGGDTNIAFNMFSKGNGALGFYTNMADLQLGVTHTASAVNYANITGAATTASPTISALGTDSNITLTLTGKGTSGVAIKGVSTNTAAAVGYVGELIESTVLAGSAVSLTTGTITNVTSISLTPGQWQVFGNTVFAPNGATITSSAETGISSTSATFATLPNGGGAARWGGTITGNRLTLNVNQSIKVSGTTTYYLVAVSDFTTNTSAVYGYLGAVRVR